MSEKIRLDTALVERGMISSRERAKTTIMSGQVYVNGQKADKAGTFVKADDKIEVRGDTLKYVSRGGLKLEKAMEQFPINVSDKIALDAGASTGGFTDCMLKNGARKVYAVDVGYGQLAWSLRNDSRVVNMERTNIRYVTHEHIPEELDFAVVDVSFISLSIVLPPIRALLSDDAQMICLVKPQFEAGRDKVGKKGVVRDPMVHEEVLQNFLNHAKDAGFVVSGLTYSPIKGPEGNIEYLGYLCTHGEPANVDIEALVSESHMALKG